MMKLVYAYYAEGVRALGEGAEIDDLVKIPAREQIGRYKYTKPEEIDAQYKAVSEELIAEIGALAGKEDR